MLFGDGQFVEREAAQLGWVYPLLWGPSSRFPVTCEQVTELCRLLSLYRAGHRASRWSGLESRELLPPLPSQPTEVPHLPQVSDLVFN